MRFTALDYIVLFVYLIATAILGVLLGKGQKNTRDYFLAGKEVPWWAISLSIVATETSALTFIGVPALAYTSNMTFLQVVIGYLFGRVLVSVFLLPAYFRGEIQTAYELLNIRFGGQVRDLSALLFLVTRTLADGVRLFAAGLVLSVITQIPDTWTVLIIGVITLTYTFYGGMTAVIWNDVVQLVIYVLGALLAFYILLEKIPGGWSEVTAIALPLNKFQIFDWNFDFSQPYTCLAGFVGGAFLTFATHGTDQMMVQRYLACGNQRGSQLAVVISGVLVFLQFFLFLLIGVMLYSFYQHFPLDYALDQPDRIFPVFIVEQMPAGVSGLVIAAVFAAAMSTLSSSLNSLASSSVNDFYRVYVVKGAPDSHYLVVSRIATLIWGVLLIKVSLLARNWGSVLEVGLTITSITMGSILGVFLLGLWSSRPRQLAGLAGMIVGVATMLLVSQSQTVAWTWYVFIGTTVTFFVGQLVSVLCHEN